MNGKCTSIKIVSALKKKHHSFVIASYRSSLLRILLHVFGIYSYMYKRGIY